MACKAALHIQINHGMLDIGTDYLTETHEYGKCLIWNLSTGNDKSYSLTTTL